MCRVNKVETKESSSPRSLSRVGAQPGGLCPSRRGTSPGRKGVSVPVPSRSELAGPSPGVQPQARDGQRDRRSRALQAAVLHSPAADWRGLGSRGAAFGAAARQAQGKAWPRRGRGGSRAPGPAGRRGLRGAGREAAPPPPPRWVRARRGRGGGSERAAGRRARREAAAARPA